MPKRKKDDVELTLVQAAALPELADLDVTPAAIRAAIKRGKLTGKKKGRDWFVFQSDLMYWKEHSAHFGGKPRKNRSTT